MVAPENETIPRPLPRAKARRWPRVLLACLAPLAFLALVESGLRLAGLGDPAPMYRHEVLPNGSEIYRTNIPAFGRDLPSTTEINPSPETFAVKPPAGTRRIFIVGASTVFGTGYAPYHTLPKWIGIRLRTLFPGAAIEVINAGLPGIDSRNLIRVVSAVLDYRPDLVVIYSGHNELLDPNVYALLHPIAWWWREQSVDWNLLRLLRALVTSGDRRPTRTLDLPAEGGPLFSRPMIRPELRHKALLAYGENLRTMVRICRDARVGVVLCTTACRAWDYPPVQAAFSKEVSEATRGQAIAQLGQARAAMRQESWETALEHLDRLLRIDGRISLVRYLRGRTLVELGREREARVDLQAAVDLDGLPNRAGSDFVAVVRDVARREGVPLADIARELESVAPQGLGDARLFFDFCHPTVRGQCLMAGVIVRCLGRHGLLWPARDWDWQREPAIEDYLAAHPMDSQAEARTFHNRSLANLRKYLMSVSTGEELGMALAHAREACRLAPDAARYRGVLGLLECLAGEGHEGWRHLADAQQGAPGVLADLARLMGASPRLESFLREAGLRVTEGGFRRLDAGGPPAGK